MENARARHAARDRAGGRRLEADDGRDFVRTTEALREDLAACTGFLDLVRAIIGADK